MDRLSPVRLRAARPDDHPRLVAAVDAWWGGRRLSQLLQPLFLENFSTTSLVAETADGGLAGFLVGFVSGDDPQVAYVHFVGVAPELRGAGLGRDLYARFAEQVAARGARRIRCVTSAVNTGSVAFHEAIGFRVVGHRPSPDVDGGSYVRLQRDLPPAAPRLPGPVTLRGSLVTLRPLAASDTDALWRTCGRPEAFAWVWPYAMGSREQMASFVAKALTDADAGLRVPFAQVATATGDTVGSTSYLDIDLDHRHVEIGWTVLSPDVWRTGINVEAKLLLLGHAFDELGMERVALKTDHRNERSQRAIAALGARHEGVLRHHVRREDGSWRDSVYFSVLRDEWPDVRRRLLGRLAAGGQSGLA